MKMTATCIAWLTQLFHDTNEMLSNRRALILSVELHVREATSSPAAASVCIAASRMRAIERRARTAIVQLVLTTALRIIL
jgi:hypothetical protein